MFKGLIQVSHWLVIAAVLLASAGCSTMNTGAQDEPGPSYTAHNVVLIIPDGMHVNNEIAASRYLYGTDKGLSFHSWPYQAPMSTWDVSTYDRYAWERNTGQVRGASQSTEKYNSASFDPLVGYDPSLGGTRPREGGPAASDWYFIEGLPVWGATPDDGVKEPATDSASAATAFSTGRKTDDGNLAWLPGDPADGSLTTILEGFRNQLGGAIGACSTVQFSHATPAAFLAHNVNRNNYGEIAHEIITETQPDYCVGAGHPTFTQNGDGTPNDRYCPVDDLDALKGNPDYIVVERQTGANGGVALADAVDQAVADGKKVFGIFGGAGGNFETPIPSDTPGQPSFQVEEANPSLAEVAVAGLELLSQNPNGFILILEQGELDWENHDNDFAGYIGAMYDTEECAKAVVDWINQDGDAITLDNTMVILLPDHTHYIRLGSALGQGDLPEQVAWENGDQTDPWMHNWQYPDGESVWASQNHTNELGMIYAIGGDSAARFASYEGRLYTGTRIVDNCDIYAVMAGWLGVQ
ncbi:alkaline phosphatase [bacterium]|nr:alkaline phosphatase [bacterium]